MRLIDADALLNSIKGRKTRSYPKGELEWTIERQPTVGIVTMDRNRIIDEFAQKMYRRVADSSINKYKDDVVEMIDEILEEMKERKNE